MVIQHHEIVLLILALAAAAFFLAYRRPILDLPAGNILLVAFSALLGAWTLTLFDEWVLPQYLNIMETCLYAVASGLLFWWAWRQVAKKG